MFGLKPSKEYTGSWEIAEGLTLDEKGPKEPRRPKGPRNLGEGFSQLCEQIADTVNVLFYSQKLLARDVLQI